MLAIVGCFFLPSIAFLAAVSMLLGWPGFAFLVLPSPAGSFGLRFSEPCPRVQPRDQDPGRKSLGRAADALRPKILSADAFYGSPEFVKHGETHVRVRQAGRNTYARKFLSGTTVPYAAGVVLDMARVCGMCDMDNARNVWATWPRKYYKVGIPTWFPGNVQHCSGMVHSVEWNGPIE